MHVMGRRVGHLTIRARRRGRRLLLLIRGRTRNDTIVVEVVVDVLQLKAWDKFCEEGGALVHLRLDKICVSTGLEGLAVPVLLVALYASRLAGAATGML